MNINKNHKSIDSYFESARKQKSPVSRDKARSLLEKDGLLNTQTFFSKKGVKAMTVATSIIIVAMIGSIGFGVFDKNSNHIKPDKEPIAITKEIKSEPQKTANISEETKKEEIQQVSGKTSNVFDEKNTMIKGMNTITLGEEELNELGIYYGTFNENGKLLQGIKFSENHGKSINEHLFVRETYCNNSVHSIKPYDSNIKIIKLQPALITDFDGTKRYTTEISSDNLPVLDEFISFHQTLTNLFKLDFTNGYQPDMIPEEINMRINELIIQLEVFNTEKKDIKNNDNKINNLLRIVYDYFYSIANDSINKRKNYSLNKQDTNFHNVIIGYPENPDDSLNIKYSEQMAKIGVKVIYEKPRVSLKSFLEKNNKKLEIQLTSINRQIENYIISNKLIAIKIPYKNHSDSLGLIFWFYPTSQLIELLPERYRLQLKREFKIIENNEPYCGAPIDIEKAYLDVWRTCSGAMENLRIFPNPVKDILNIKFELKENRDITFVVHDLTGRKVKDVSKTEYYNSGTISVSLNLSNITQGMYYIVAKSNNNEQVMQRFIKE